MKCTWPASSSRREGKGKREIMEWDKGNCVPSPRGNHPKCDLRHNQAPQKGHQVIRAPKEAVWALLSCDNLFPAKFPAGARPSGPARTAHGRRQHRNHQRDPPYTAPGHQGNDPVCEETWQGKCNDLCAQSDSFEINYIWDNSNGEICKSIRVPKLLDHIIYAS